MKKILLALICLVMLAQVNAASISNASNTAANNSKKSTDNYFKMILQVTAYDACGQKLSFSVSCTGCTWADLGAQADQTIFDHTDANGCFFL